MQTRPYNGILPTLGERAYIDPAASVIGDVVLGDDASVWPFTVIRGDVNFIRIGDRSNIQDGTVIHCDSAKDGGEGFPTIIGEDVLIGHLAMVHGCTLADRAFVGLKATVMNGCVIGSDAMLAAGALLTEHKEIPGRELWAGSPARRVRDIDDAQAAGMQMGVAHYVHNGRVHKAAVEG